MSRANFVQVQLAAAATDTQTTLSVKAPVGGFVLPPADGGRLVLTDSPGRPNAFEVITYTGRTGTGPTYTLTGVVRGQEGTVGLAWGVDAYVMQALTAGELTSLLDAKVDKATGQSLMLDAERTKLSGIAEGAQVNTVNSVAGKTGAVVLAKADVGLANVDNTSDLSKPVSTATQAALNAKANLASPALTGTPTAPTAATTANNTQIANTAFVQAVVAALVNGAPGALDQLSELAAAMGNDPNFATTMLNALALKAPLASPTFTGDPKAPTAAADDNDTTIATTAFVRAAMALFGIGGSTKVWPKTTLNDFTVETGFYRAAANVTDTPYPEYWGIAIEKAPDGLYVRQSLWCLNGSARLFERVITNGVSVPWQELWHTGNLAKQTSTTDTTPGALMAVGAFGLGRESHPGSVYVTDANALTATGDYAVGATWTGSPTAGTSGANQGSLRHIANFQTTAYARQEWASLTVSTPIAMARNKINGVWTPWFPIFHTGNILGTVSQAGGVPTGAIIERGSNANGEYVRFADGTQICTLKSLPGSLAISTAIHGGYRTSGLTWTYPAPFAATPAASGTASENSALSVSTYSVGTSACGYVLLSVGTQTAQDRRADLIAIGRWY